MNKPIYLPPALLGDPSKLSVQAHNEIRELSGAKPTEFIIWATGTWVTIFLTVALANYIDNTWLTLLAIIIIGTRLNVFGLLVHEQAHSLGFRGKYGDNIANILVAYPLGITVEDYANVHLSHHKFFLTQDDPDFLRKTGQNWIFPMPYKNLVKLFIKDLTGFSFMELLKSKKLEKRNLYRRLHPSPRWLRPAYYLAVAVLLTYSDSWHLFLIYWILPLVFVFPAVVRIGAICEHIYDLPPGSGVIQSSPLILLRWWEKLIIPDLNFKLHAYHHFFPGVAFCNLPEVHKIFQREHLVDEKAVFHGFLAFLKHLQSQPVLTGNP